MSGHARIARRLMSGTIGLVLAVSGVVGIRAAAAEPPVSLDIAPIAQRFSPPVNGDAGTYDCLPAATAMALAYFQARGTFSGPTVTYDAVRTAYRRLVPGGAPLSPSHAPAVVAAISGGSLDATAAYRPGADWRAWLHTELAEGRPVLASVPDWRLLSPPGHPTAEAGFTDPEPHTVVVIGLSDTDVTYNDPWDGKRWSLPVDLFGAAWLDGGSQITATWFSGSPEPPTSPTPTSSAAPPSQSAEPSSTPGESSSPPASPSPSLAAPTAGWALPTQGATITTTRLLVSATPTNDSHPAKVVYSIVWGDVARRTACIATVAAKDGTWSCTADLVKLGALRGTLTLGFDVYGDVGIVTSDPDGTRNVFYAPTPSWTKPRRIDPVADCSSVAAAVDSASRQHIAAGCAGSIRYLVTNPDGTWSTTTFAPPRAQEELGPQLAFQGTTVYLAYTRNPTAAGCGDGNGVAGVFYRKRDLPNGRWSDPVRIGVANDGLQSFRQSAGTLFATVQSQLDGRQYYETLKGTTYHRYPIPDANGFVSLRVGTDGRARIAYRGTDGLRFGVFDGSRFVVSSVTSPDRYDWGPVLVLDSSANAHILWTHSPPPGGCALDDPSPQDGTYYATNTGGTWKAERFTTIVGETSLQVDGATGQLHAIVGGTGGLSYFTRSAGGSWTQTRLTSDDVSSPVIRLDPTTGTLLVVYIGASSTGAPAGLYVLTLQ